MLFQFFFAKMSSFLFSKPRRRASLPNKRLTSRAPNYSLYLHTPLFPCAPFFPFSQVGCGSSTSPFPSLTNTVNSPFVVPSPLLCYQISRIAPVCFHGDKRWKKGKRYARLSIFAFAPIVFDQKIARNAVAMITLPPDPRRVPPHFLITLMVYLANWVLTDALVLDLMHTHIGVYGSFISRSY